MDFNGWEKLSLVDFDDHISMTLFTSGCNMRCPFCHNKSLVLTPSGNPKIDWDDVKDYLERRKGIIDAVVITGGEPTINKDLIDKIQEIKKYGYLVKLDSNGTNPDLLIDLVNLGLVDYVAMDIKNCLDKYGETCGNPSIDLEKVKESVRFLIDGVVDYEFRTTIIDEFHSKDDMERIGHLIEGAKRYFLQKYVDGENCIKSGFHEVSKEKALIYKAIMSKYVNEVNLRGYE